MCGVCVNVWPTKWFNRYADRSVQTNKNTCMTNGSSAVSAEQEISAITTHTHTPTLTHTDSIEKEKENRQDAATDEMIH